MHIYVRKLRRTVNVRNPRAYFAAFSQGRGGRRFASRRYGGRSRYGGRFRFRSSFNRSRFRRRGMSFRARQGGR